MFIIKLFMNKKLHKHLLFLAKIPMLWLFARVDWEWVRLMPKSRETMLNRENVLSIKQDELQY